MSVALVILPLRFHSDAQALHVSVLLPDPLPLTPLTVLAEPVLRSHSPWKALVIAAPWGVTFSIFNFETRTKGRRHEGWRKALLAFSCLWPQKPAWMSQPQSPRLPSCIPHSGTRQDLWSQQGAPRVSMPPAAQTPGPWEVSPWWNPSLRPLGNLDLICRRLFSEACVVCFLYEKINPKAFCFLTLKWAFPFLLVDSTVLALLLSTRPEMLGSFLHRPSLFFLFSPSHWMCYDTGHHSAACQGLPCSRFLV